MGVGYELECKSCGKSHAVLLGSGMRFPVVYEKLVTDIEAGRYGKECQELAAQTPFFAIDAESYLFCCENCGFWECAPSLSIYAPKDIEKVLNKRYGEKTVREWGRAPYVMTKDLESDYTLVKERIHTCDRCGSDMRISSEREAQRTALKCPDCGGELERNPLCILWD